VTERDYATEVVERLTRRGHVAVWAGGCVRDELLGLTPADYDIATDATPEQVQAAFRRSHSFGASFGVVEVLGPRGGDGEWLKVQVATFRSDGTYSDGRRPDAVTFSSPEEDAKRRDFTVNGMFLNPLTGEVADYVGGRADLAAGVLRAIGDPAERFAEDKLRLLRAVRMAARFGLTIDPATFAAVEAMAGQVTAVSAERIAEELRKILTHPERVRGLMLMRDAGLVAPVLPRLADQIDAAIDRLAGLPERVSFELAFATLFPEAAAKAVEKVARQLRLSNDEADRVGWLVAHRSAFDVAETLPLSQLKPLLAHPGAAELLDLHRARGVTSGVEFCERFLARTPPGDLNPPPLVTGDDLTALGMTPGPHFKRILAAVRAAQLENRLPSKTAALSMVAELRPS
jgi:poly(A) polymerase